MKHEDKLMTFEGYGENYTLKVYKRGDSKYYSLVVYETDTEAKVIFTSMTTTTIDEAKKIATKNAQKHESENKK